MGSVVPDGSSRASDPSHGRRTSDPLHRTQEELNPALPRTGYSSSSSEEALPSCCPAHPDEERKAREVGSRPSHQGSMLATAVVAASGVVAIVVGLWYFVRHQQAHGTGGGGALLQLGGPPGAALLSGALPLRPAGVGGGVWPPGTGKRAAPLRSLRAPARSQESGALWPEAA